MTSWYHLHDSTGRASHYRALVLLVSLVLMAAETMALARSAGAMEANMADDSNMTTWCAGRFAFELPASFRLLGRRQSIYRVEVDVAPMPEGATADHLWARRLTEIRRLKAPRGVEQVVIREGMTGPDFPGVFYYGNSSNRDVAKLEGQKVVGGNLLNLRLEGKANKGPEMRKLLNITANGYEPLEPGALPDKPGFCVGRGIITTEPGRREKASMSFGDEALDVTVHINLRTVSRVDPFDPLDEIEDTIPALAQEGATVKILRRAKLEISNLEGYEGIVAFDSEAEGGLKFTWRYPGTAKSHTHPEITVKMTAPRAEDAEFMAELMKVWQGLLGSLRPAYATR